MSSRGPWPFHQRGGEAAKGVVALIRAGEDDDAEGDARVVQVEQVSLDVLAGPPTRLDLEADHWQSTVEARYGDRRLPSPHHVETAAGDSVFGVDAEARAVAGVNEKLGELAVECRGLAGSVLIHTRNHCSSKTRPLKPVSLPPLTRPGGPVLSPSTTRSSCSA